MHKLLAFLQYISDGLFKLLPPFECLLVLLLAHPGLLLLDLLLELHIALHPPHEVVHVVLDIFWVVGLPLAILACARGVILLGPGIDIRPKITPVAPLSGPPLLLPHFLL